MGRRIKRRAWERGGPARPQFFRALRIRYIPVRLARPHFPRATQCQTQQNASHSDAGSREYRLRPSVPTHMHAGTMLESRSAPQLQPHSRHCVKHHAQHLKAVNNLTLSANAQTIFDLNKSKQRCKTKGQVYLKLLRSMAALSQLYSNYGAPCLPEVSRIDKRMGEWIVYANLKQLSIDKTWILATRPFPSHPYAQPRQTHKPHIRKQTHNEVRRRETRC